MLFWEIGLIVFGVVFVIGGCIFLASVLTYCDNKVIFPFAVFLTLLGTIFILIGAVKVTKKAPPMSEEVYEMLLISLEETIPDERERVGLIVYKDKNGTEYYIELNENHVPTSREVSGYYTSDFVVKYRKSREKPGGRDWEEFYYYNQQVDLGKGGIFYGVKMPWMQNLFPKPEWLK